MNEIHRKALLKNKNVFVQDITVTESFLNALHEKNIFDEEMLEMIKVERTPSDKVYKLLELLPRRGPNAFNSFLLILKDKYDWLATKLHDTVQELMNQKTAQPGQSEVTSQKTSVQQSHDPDIKTKVGTFVHKQFGQSKRIHQTDIKAMEKWLTVEIQQERKRVQLYSGDCEDANNTIEKASSPEPSDVIQAEFQNKLNELHKKCEPHLNLVQHEINNNEEDKISPCDTLRDITLTVIETDLDFIVNKLAKLESQITQMHELLDDPEKKSLTINLVKEMKKQHQQYEKELNQEKQKTENMQTELDNYSKHINKLELLKQQMRSQLDLKENEIAKLRHENALLQKKYESLHQIHMQHAEKEKTLENLRKLAKDLQESRLNSQNANYRKKMNLIVHVPQTKKASKTGATRQGSKFNQQFQYSSQKGKTGKTSPIRKLPHPSSNKP